MTRANDVQKHLHKENDQSVVLDEFKEQRDQVDQMNAEFAAMALDDNEDELLSELD